jgi:hypothetical protein
MPKTRPMRHISLLVTTLLWQGACGQATAQAASARPIRLPGDSALDMVVTVESLATESIDSTEGDTLLLHRARYTEGTDLRHPIALRIPGLPLPLEIVILHRLCPCRLPRHRLLSPPVPTSLWRS